MQLADYTVKPCSSRAAFEFLPQKRMTLDLARCARTLEEKGFGIEAKTPFLLALRTTKKTGSIGATLFASGRMLVKSADEKKAGAAAHEVASALDPPN